MTLRLVAGRRVAKVAFAEAESEAEGTSDRACGGRSFLTGPRTGGPGAGVE